jgi:hypothetical protein
VTLLAASSASATTAGTTGSNGTATCRGPFAVLAARLAGRYTATYAGTPSLAAATATGYLIKQA